MTIKNKFPFYLSVIVTVSISLGLVVISLAPMIRASDSSSACWNMDGIIDPHTGACILPECPPGTVRESTTWSGTKCHPVEESQENLKQLDTSLSQSSAPQAAVGQNINNTSN